MTIYNLDSHLGTCLQVLSKTDNMDVCTSIMEDDLVPTISRLETGINDSFKKLLLSKLVELIKNKAPIQIINKFAENVIQALLFVDDETGIVIPTTVNCLLTILTVFNSFFKYGVDHKHHVAYFDNEDFVFYTEFTRFVDVLLTGASDSERLLFASILSRPH